MTFDLLLTDVRLSPMDDGSAAVRGDVDAIGIVDGSVQWLGREADLPSGTEARSRRSLGGRWTTPALVDCHTHLVFAGDRSGEWARRLAGERYADIASEGGGIRATVAATRDAPTEHLARDAAERLRVLAADGVGTVEIKSGYGLTVDHELRMLRAAHTAGDLARVRVVTTLLAAHAVPEDYHGRPDAYIDEVCVPALVEGASEGIVDAVDGYLESIAFSRPQLARLFDAARERGVPIRLHADQLSDGGGAAFAAESGALSADHLEYTNVEGVRAMAGAGTVAVLLPGAWYGLREATVPPVEAFREHGVPMAVATDANPGTSPLLSLRASANMACTLFGLTVDEAFAGVTRHAAAALGRPSTAGRVAVGVPADLAVWDVPGPARLLNWIGDRPLYGRVLRGEWA